MDDLGITYEPVRPCQTPQIARITGTDLEVDLKIIEGVIDETHGNTD